VRNGRADDVIALMAEGADIEYKDQVLYVVYFGCNVFMIIAECVYALMSSTSVCRSQLQFADVGGFYSQWRYTALICAAVNGHADCARLLIDAGADKDAKNNVRVSNGTASFLIAFYYFI
jgi:hypothetical protein